MTVRKILFWVAIWLLALLVGIFAGRVFALFLPPALALWLGRLFLAPPALIGLIVAFILLLTIVLCLGRIKYRVDAHVGNDKTAYVEISYLFRLVNFVAEYRDKKFENHTRVAWMKFGEKKPRKKKKRKSKVTVPNGDEQKAHNIAAHIGPSEESITPKSQPAGKTMPSDIENSEPEQKEKKDRLKPLKQAKAVLTYPDLKTIIGLCFQCLQKFIKALKPKRLDISGIIGFDDPCTTGWFMGAYEAAAGTAQLRHKIRLLGSYHEKALQLDIEAKGRTSLWGLLWPFIWLYLHKPIRVAIHEHILREEDLDE